MLSTVDVGLIPYWATTSADGKSCLVSVSGDSDIVVVDYASGEMVTRVPVGKFPQRNRLGQVPESVLALLAPSPAERFVAAAMIARTAAATVCAPRRIMSNVSRAAPHGILARG